jgi:hypothetical protein
MPGTRPGMTSLILKQPFAFSRSVQPRFKGGGDAGDFPIPSAACVKRKNADEVVTARPETISGIPQRAWRLRHSRQLRAVVFSLLRMTPGGLTLLSTAADLAVVQ